MMFARSKPAEPRSRAGAASSGDERAAAEPDGAASAIRIRPWRKSRGAVAGLAWLYVIIVLAGWLLMRRLGDRWWAATLILFGPRWVFAAPLALLLPLALWLRRRSLAVLLAGALLTLFLVMDFRVPWQRLMRASGSGATVRVLTCNTNGKTLDAAALRRAIAENHPDIVALQEWSHGNVPAVFADGNWNILNEGELCLASRYPIQRVEGIGGHNWSWSGAAVRYRVQSPGGEFNFVNLHLESPHLAFLNTLKRHPKAPAQVARNSRQRLWQAEQLRIMTENYGDDVVLSGDFNLPADSSIYRRSLSGFENAFSTSGWGFGWTYYARATITRIDHILMGSGWRSLRCWVGPDVGSPHRPVIADLQRVTK